MNEKHEDDCSSNSDQTHWDPPIINNDFKDLNDHNIFLDLRSEINIQITDLDKLSTTFKTANKRILSNLQ